ncbi:Cytochrome b-c1 complex subunit 7 [Schistosoma japonicum]|uniref:Cytochrome b-c1 complex subunit 7 n=1 Tax=Schistosoma japonicum TaxID=6182 RepID=Q86EV2_SCHJA|nr:SJCHGC00717 protein [Schistosoma japonicum]TNN14119.1 Cytochrome b-c1 complex subunit 7 [Schistosoma japonicum]
MAHLRVGADFIASYRSRFNQMGDLRKKLKLFSFNTSYYNQVGLLKHDWLPHSPALVEALRRLPRDELEARDFRIARASLLYASKNILPKEQWTTIENDIPYLDPYINVVVKEHHDQTSWDNFVSPVIYRGP